MPEVFISYSHKDSEYAHRLADELRRHAIDVWIDERIDYGEQWPRVIQDNLTACKIFLLVMSTNAFNSMWVQNEVSFAQANNKPIFPLLLEGQVWLAMAAMQYVDVRDGKMPPERFYEELRMDLNQPTPPAPKRQAPAATRTPAARKPASPKSKRWMYVVVPLVLCVGMMCVLAPIAWNWLNRNSNGPSVPEKVVTLTKRPATQAPAPMEPTEEPYIPPSAGDEPTPTPAPADVYAPDPLGPEFSGMWFPLGSCYDMDVLYDTNDDACDLVLEYNGTLVPVNGGLLSGYAFDAPPDIVVCNEVISPIQSDEPVAVQSDLYMCFLTNAGRYGFFVAREINIENGIVFDAYLFP